jgi:ethanolamine ammonia-lyase small subunit
MSEIIENPWTRLRSFTSARLALGRVGDSLPTGEVLNFGMAHAQARDAVHQALDVERMAHDLSAAGFKSLTVQSAVRDRNEYLRRPDLGRKLSNESRALLAANSQQFSRDSDRLAIFIIADGLSAIAPGRHALPLLREVVARYEDLQSTPVIVATQARVALGDEIGEMLGAEMTVMLIGERPGLSAPDSLGIYLTYRPRIGCTDAGRNCISNIRPEGLSYEAAAHKLHHLMLAARKLGRSGIALKDESDLQRLP